MGRRFKGDYLSNYGKTFTVIIHDVELGTDPEHSMNVTDLQIKWERAEIFEPIMTSRASVGILMDSEETFDFLDDIKNMEEGRFYLEVLVDLNLLGGPVRHWYHKIILNKATLAHTYKPTLTLPSSDGIADLSQSVYDVHPNFGYASVKDIIAAILGKIGVTEFYGSSDVLFEMQTNLKANGTGYTLNEFFKFARLGNYFKVKKEGVYTAMKCYDVLKEVCNRFFLRLYYAQGKYIFLGREGIHDGRQGKFYRYSKTGALVNEALVLNVNQDLFTVNRLLDGGSLSWNGGYRSVKIQCSGEHVNKKQAYDISWVLTGTNTYQAEYKTIGDALADIDYQLLIATQVTGIGNTTPPDKVTMYVEIKEKRISTGVETNLTQMYYDIPFEKGNYDNKVDILAVSYDREIIVRFKMTVQNPNGTNISMIVSTDLTESDINVNDAYFRSYLTDTKNVLDKTINMMACDEFGSNLVKIAFWDGVATNAKKYSTGWKLNSADASFGGLENKMTYHMLKYLRKNREIFEKDVNLKDGLMVDMSRTFIWDSTEYFIIGADWNVKDDVFNVSGERVVDGSTTGILDEDYSPIEVNATSGFTDITGQIAKKKPYYRLFENAGASVTLTDYSFPIPISGQAITLKSARKSIEVYVNHIKQVVYLETPLPTGRPNVVHVNTTTGVITFINSTNKLFVEVRITDWFEFGTAT